MDFASPTRAAGDMTQQGVICSDKKTLQEYWIDLNYTPGKRVDIAFGVGIDVKACLHRNSCLEPVGGSCSSNLHGQNHVISLYILIKLVLR